MSALNVGNRHYLDSPEYCFIAHPYQVYPPELARKLGYAAPY